MDKHILNKKGEKMLNKLIDKFTAWKQRKEFENNIKRSQEGAVITQLLSSQFDKNVERTKHPLHDQRLKDYKNIIKTWKKKKEVDINFGDSLTDMSRKQIEEVHDGVFSISGSWAHHMKMMVEDLSSSLSKIKVKNVSIGCLGGNPMLVYQNFEEIVKDSIECLDKIREIFPEARIIVYGIPPVYNIYATTHSYDFDLEILKWIGKDKDARFISLKNHFGQGFARLFPDMTYSSDGVHFNPNGANLFADLIKKEKK
jgi:hypothetical protein